VIVARVPSLSDPAKRYVIEKTMDGSLACSCQAFGSWKKRGKPCWHLRVWASVSGVLRRCLDAGHVAVATDGNDLSVSVVCEACLLSVVAAMTGKIKRDYVSKEAVKAAKREAAARKAAKKKTKKKK
jgi:hypothetical protein